MKNLKLLWFLIYGFASKKGNVNTYCSASNEKKEYLRNILLLDDAITPEFLVSLLANKEGDSLQDIFALLSSKVSFNDLATAEYFDNDQRFLYYEPMLKSYLFKEYERESRLRGKVINNTDALTGELLWLASLYGVSGIRERELIEKATLLLSHLDFSQRSDCVPLAKKINIQQDENLLSFMKLLGHENDNMKQLFEAIEEGQKAHLKKRRQVGLLKDELTQANIKLKEEEKEHASWKSKAFKTLDSLWDLVITEGRLDLVVLYSLQQKTKREAKRMPKQIIKMLKIFNERPLVEAWSRKANISFGVLLGKVCEIAEENNNDELIAVLEDTLHMYLTWLKSLPSSERKAGIKSFYRGIARESRLFDLGSGFFPWIKQWKKPTVNESRKEFSHS